MNEYIHKTLMNIFIHAITGQFFLRKVADSENSGGDVMALVMADFVLTFELKLFSIEIQLVVSGVFIAALLLLNVVCGTWILN